ncbi:MAG: hypothetical protein JHC95_00035 [Solirubrobacteraceae bacterium]|nr:hypothetical protein [Solirubrobacteraceae bacterium]
MHPARLMLVPLAVLALVAAGCGQSKDEEVSFNGAEAQVADVVTDLSAAAEDDDAARICGALLGGDLAGSDCKAKMDQAIDDSDTFSLDVRDVTITGNTAVATVNAATGDAKRSQKVTLERDGSNWKITGF